MADLIGRHPANLMYDPEDPNLEPARLKSNINESIEIDISGMSANQQSKMAPVRFRTNHCQDENLEVSTWVNQPRY